MKKEEKEIGAIVVGAGGRMGGRLIHAIQESSSIKLSGAVERPDHPSLGKDAGELHGLGKLGISLKGELSKERRRRDHQLQQPFCLDGESGIRPQDGIGHCDRHHRFEPGADREDEGTLRWAPGVSFHPI